MTHRTILPLAILTLAIAFVLVRWNRDPELTGTGMGRTDGPPWAAERAPGEPPGRDFEQGQLGRPRLRGSVLDADSGAPLAGHVVHVTTLGAREAVDTGKDGGFDLELDPDAWLFGSLITASVRDARGKLLVTTPIATDAPLELRVPPPTRLAGRLAYAPPLEYAGRTVTVYTSRENGTASKLHCGSGALAPDGSFSIEILEPLQPAQYLLDFATGLGTSFLLSVPRADLVSDSGATLERHWARIVFRAQDSAGEPLAGLSIRVASDLHVGDLGVEAGRTDGAGHLTLPLSAGTYAVYAALPGHAPYVDTFDVPRASSALELDLELRRLGDADILRGVLLSPIGEPVAGALVELRSAVPVAALVPTPIASARTLGDGRFELACDSRALLDVSAWHSEYGFLAREGITIDERRLRLKFDATGSARIDVSIGDSEEVPAAPVQYFVLGEGGAVVRSGRAHSPISVRPLRTGDYQSLVLGPGGATYGRATFSIGTVSEQVVPIRLRPARRVSGQIEDSSGAPAPDVLVQVLHPTWPEDVSSAWGKAVSGRDGAFSVSLGAASSADLLAGGVRTAVSADEPARLRVSGSR